MRPTLTQAEDIKLVLAAVLLGMMIGALYDIFTFFRVMRESGKSKRIIEGVLCFFEDVFFFILVSALNVVLFSAYGGARVRLEGIVFQLVSFILWHFTVGRISRKIFLKLKIKIKRLLGAVYQRTAVPLMRRITAGAEKARKKKEQKCVKKYSEKAKKELKSKLRQKGAKT